MLAIAVAVVCCLAQSVLAYIPALPTNSTDEAIEAGLNVTELSKLRMQWNSNGANGIGWYVENVSYQLAGNGSTGISKGALVHFSEERANNMTPPTNTPWIALVSCDRNATDMSMDEDIFTMARDRGAVAALLYSLYSLACVINTEYANPSTFDQVFDIFSTQSRTSAHLIEYQFGQLGLPQNRSLFDYNSTMLNNSYDDITKSIEKGYPVSQGYLLAQLQAHNATDSITEASPGTDPAPSASSGNTRPDSALAMIVLYAITGCVSALFCIVVISGAIRAIRHPERYGPRARGFGGEGGGQSRARGLTRAILDTFPIVKFGSNVSAAAPPAKDIESTPNGAPATIPLEAVTPRPDKPRPQVSFAQDLNKTDKPPPATEIKVDGEVQDSPGSSPVVDSHPAEAPVIRRPSKASKASNAERDEHNVVPDAIGRETCPICIVDFEEGDDVRVLPCEGKHCFHQSCVDPWLLELSSSCPICRHDFFALENMISGRSDDGGHENYDPPQDYEPHHNHHHPHLNRFSRYIRFAVGRRRRRHDEPDPTDPYMPQAPVTTLY
ncbi:RING-7 protein [Coprinopsis cinerea okayama7|uniref:RING-7 protein n=1 Tax=Coprinopsis cinerea (strain Okayama-7 / 130 / ATCC MYA-4618 / FGSC 9003) TaxID=240176 RepID=A8N6X3_COPC7|nr:RING-7 protein [Coprinopsis cinerea okayama7\|eukprot:XP_001830579.2 RING-7 protein [Coprinopsis cinerea okayama7\